MRNYINLVEGNSITAPDSIADTVGKTIFLAGSIDMGKAIDWQTEVEKSFADIPVTLFNPRRRDWDSSWKQDIANAKFAEQVEWELDAQDAADIILMYFDPKGQAPITLLELGMYAPMKKSNMVVCCAEGYWRRGNVQVVCERYGVKIVDTLEDLIAEGKKLI